MEPTGGADLEALGRQRHAEGDYAGALEAFERAYEAHRRAGDLRAAARAARTVAWFRGWVLGEWAVSQGWAGRARALVERAGAGHGRARGWALLEKARAGHDLEAQRRLYLAARDEARRAGDGDLECEATTSLGMMLVFSGLVPEGMSHLDDALAAICAGDVEELSVVEGCLCGLLNACERTHDVVRAGQWLRAAGEVMERRRLRTVAGYCRAHYGSILVAAGRWAEAEVELTGALAVLPEASAVRSGALCRLADLRVRQGRAEEAIALLAGLEHHEDAARPLAAAHLARGEPELAVEVVDRALAAGPLPDYVEAPLLALAVDAHLAGGDPGAARAAGARLTDLAVSQPAPYVAAIAALAAARLCTAGDEGDARACLHRAMALFARASMPVEVARCRLELARLVAAERPPVAMAEAMAAAEILERLGARRDADVAASLLRSLGGSTRPGPRRGTALTRREEEVLALLGQGLTNAQIGERLFISAKTVEHHVGRVLAKLGVRSRAEAVARSLGGK